MEKMEKLMDLNANIKPKVENVSCCCSFKDIKKDIIINNKKDKIKIDNTDKIDLCNCCNFTKSKTQKIIIEKTLKNTSYIKKMLLKKVSPDEHDVMNCHCNYCIEKKKILGRAIDEIENSFQKYCTY